MTKPERRIYEIGRLIGHLQSSDVRKLINSIDEKSYVNNDNKYTGMIISIKIGNPCDNDREYQGEHIEF